MSTVADYQFPGCAPFVGRAADAQDLADARLRAKAKSLEPLAKIQAALGQACNRPPPQRAEIVKAAADWLAVLRVATAAAELAIRTACDGLGVDDPTRPKVAPKSPRRPATEA